MPVYNAEEYICEAIESIVNQTLQDWELIIVDEPTTTDSTDDIVRRFMENDSRIKLIINKERLGISKSLNVAIEASKGKYIVRMDADDISLPNRLQEQVNYMDANPDIGISGCDFQVQGEQWESNLLYDENDIKADLLFFVPLRHPTIIMRKELLDKNNIRYSEIFEAAEDYDLFVRSRNCFRITNLSKKLLIYRRHENATVYRMLEVGAEVNRELGKILLDELGIKASKDEIRLLYSHCLLNSRSDEYSIQKIYDFEDLLEKILVSNFEKKIYDSKSLFKVLVKRWNKEISYIRKSKNISEKDLNIILDNSIFSTSIVGKMKDELTNRKALTVIMLFDMTSNNVIKGIKSVINQIYENWTLEIICQDINSRSENKIYILDKLFSNISIRYEKQEAVVAVLNNIIMQSNTDYISLISGHEYLFKNYYDKMIYALETHSECEVCVCNVRNSTYKLNRIPDKVLVNTIFEIYPNRGGIVYRKNIVSPNNQYETGTEDYVLEFNNRLLDKFKFFVINEELLEIDIESNELEALIDNSDSLRILGQKFKRLFEMSLTEEEHRLLENGRVMYKNAKNNREEEKIKKKLSKLYQEIEDKNKKYHICDEKILASRIIAEWLWITENKDRFSQNDFYSVSDFFEMQKSKKIRLHNKIIMKMDRFFYGHSKYYHYNLMLDKFLDREVKTTKVSNAIDLQQEEAIIKRWTWERFQRTEKELDNLYHKLERKVDKKVWDAEKRIIVLDDLSMNLSFQMNRSLYDENEKIRVVILFQVASFWPSLDSLYGELLEDSRFEVIIMCYDEPVDASIKTETARKFLENNNIPYVDWMEFSLKQYKPHIVVLQTPYDSNRRKEFKSNYLKASGYRVVYVPYGMEIGDTQHSRKQQLDHIVRRYAWKIFTFSDMMHKDYRLYSEQEDNVYVTGLPKFDSLFDKEKFPLKPEILERANNKKIVLWKVHFPKVALVNGKLELFTPDVEQYLEFTKYIENDTENFYIFMPHPRFLEFNDDKKI